MPKDGRLSAGQAAYLEVGLGHPAHGLDIAERLQMLAVRGGKGVIEIGTSTDAVALPTTSNAIKIYASSSSTSGSTSEEMIYAKMTMSGAGGVGGRARFHTYSNVASGGWINAVKGLMEFGSSGSTSGLASSVCAEIQMSAGCTHSAYAALEAEIVMPTSAVTGQQTSFMYCNVSGAAAATFDTSGYFLHIGDGITAAAGKFASAAYQTLKCYFTDSSTTRYMFLSQIEDGVGIGNSSTGNTLTAGTPLFQLYTTCSSTSGSTNIEPFLMKSTLTGAGGVGGRAKFHMYTNVALGGWANALKALTEFGASGRVSGLGSALCAEIQMSAGCTQAAYAALEAEIVMPTSAVTGQQTSFLYCNTSGAAAATFDTSGYFLHVGDGITAAAGKFCSANYHTLKCYFTDSSTTRYLFLSQIENGLGIGASGSAVSFSQGSPLVAIYATNSSTHASNSVESFYCETTMTGAAGVGGRARFYMTTNVALGGWSNALKAHVAYGASGRTTGLGSAFCAELALSNGTTSGTYAALEAELVSASGDSCGTATSFLYMNATDAGSCINGANGYLFELGAGITDTAGGIFEAEANTDSMSMTHVLKIRIAGVAYYIPLNTSKTF